MITRGNCKKIKSMIGYSYAKKILAYFDLKNITRHSGKKYLENDIRHILTRARYNAELELHIWEAANYYKKLRQEKRRQIKIVKKKAVAEKLPKKKPVAVTTGYLV